MPPGEEERFWRAVEIAAMFEPLTAEETELLKTIASRLDAILQASRQSPTMTSVALGHLRTGLGY